MKKLLITAVVALSLTISIYSQDPVFGVKAGLNFSKFGQDADADGRTSFFVGGIADFEISDVLHIQPEAQFSAEGSEDAEANFLRLIGVAKYYAAEGFSLQGGPQIGIRVSADNSVEDTTNGFDFGLALGAGYELPDIPVFFDLRYNLGIANLSDVDSFDTNLGTFQLGVGYKFN